MINTNYKRIVVLVIAIFAMLLSDKTHSQDYQGDLGIRNNTNQGIIARISLVSIPFDGITANINTGTYNRIDTLQNGSLTRVFNSNNTYTEYPLHYFYKQLLTNGSSLQLGLVGGNPSDANHGYGHGVYEIYIEVPSINKKYKALFNCMDSKYGAPINGVTYGRDFNFTYLGENDDVLFTANSNFVATLRPFTDGQTVQEFKVWEMCGFGNQPLEQRFYARTTPFGISPEIIENTIDVTIDRAFLMRDFVIGGKVLFDKVYDNYGSLDRWGYNTVNELPYHRYFSDPPIPSGLNSQGNTYTTPAWYTWDLNSNYIEGCRITALSGDELVLKENKRLWVSGVTSTSEAGDTLVLNSGSIVTKENTAQLNACFGGTILDYGATMNWNPNSLSHIYERSELSYLGTSHTINNGGHIEIDDLARLKVGNNTTVTFDGAGTYLKLNPNAIVQLGENAKIEFKNGAYLDANGGTISSLNASTPGRGLFFYNSAGNTISGCTFTNLKNPIYINGTSGFFGNVTNNTFDETGNNYYNYVIETVNANNISISYNQINMQSNRGVGILMRYPASTGTAAASSSAINVYNNSIQNGMVSAAFVCLTDVYAIVNFRYNYCYGNATSANVVVRHITGEFKENNISSSSCKSLELNQAIPNLYHNTFTSANFNVNNYESYPRIAPISENTSDGGWIWAGGRNTFTSTGNGNIYYYGGNAILDWGENHFNKSASYQNLWGEINEPDPYHYYVRNNCFGNSYIPSTNLVYINDPNQPVDAIYSGSTINCNNSSNGGTIWQINDLGNGVYDTLYKTSNNSGYQPSQDEILYSSAIQKWQIDDYFSAITYYKSLITNFPASSYTDASLYSLYKCYQALDTSYNLNTKDVLYTDLKNYLDGRILTGIYSEEFNSTAYEITIMCLASIADYNEAMAGYEFIALFHPDAYTRLLASWDYAEVQALLNGSGGISSKEENLSDAQYMKTLTNRVNKAINEDPIKKKVKKSFDKVKTEKTAKLEKETFTKTKDEKSAKLEVAKMKQKDEMMNTKVTSVMRYSKTLRKEEREKMQIEDILFSRKTENKEDVKLNTGIPVVYSLSQNYPNPFNPVTKINYALPKTGHVTMKIYDVTGREIQTLVNDIKQAGNYTVDFNGANLSSGVYFYKIQSGDFISVKRMVLIK
jgi:hypothetical protein